MRMICQMLSGLLLLVLSINLHADDAALEEELAGEWIGVPETAEFMRDIHLVFELGESGWQGVMARGPMSRPLAQVHVSGNTLEVLLPQHVRIVGEYDGEQVVGKIEFGESVESIELARKGSEAGQHLLDAVAREREPHRPGPLEPVVEGPGLECLDDDALADLLAAADEAGSHGLALRYRGELVGEWYADGQEEQVHAMSVTKVVVALAVLRLLTEGELASLDTAVHEVYPEWSADARSAVTIRHLLAHSSGLDHAANTAAIYQSGDMVQFALDSELVAEPGEGFEYNNNAYNLLAGVISRLAGRPMDEYLAEEIFEPLGIDDYHWQRDEAGNPHGMAGLSIGAGDLALLGQLVLDGGEWQGRTLIDAEWIRESVRRQNEAAPVGLAWFLMEDEGAVTGYRHDGYLGQYLLILPDHELVATRMVSQGKGYNPQTDGMYDFYQRVQALPSERRQMRSLGALQ